MNEPVCAVYDVNSDKSGDGLTYRAVLGGWIGPVSDADIAMALPEFILVSEANLDGACLRLYLGSARDERATPQPPLGQLPRAN